METYGKVAQGFNIASQNFYDCVILNECIQKFRYGWGNI